MATLQIIEFARAGKDSLDNPAFAGEFPELAIQNIIISATSAQSAALNNDTKLITVKCIDSDARIKFGSNPTADGNSIHLTLGEVRNFSISSSTKGYKIAGITA